MLLSRDQILASPFKFEDMPVAEWGGDVRVRVMPGLLREQYERLQIEANKLGAKVDNLRERIIVSTVCNEQGDLLFSESDIPALSGKDWKSLDDVFLVGLRLNGMLASSVDEAEKNSEAAQNGSSISG